MNSSENKCCLRSRQISHSEILTWMIHKQINLPCRRNSLLTQSCAHSEPIVATTRLTHETTGNRNRREVQWLWEINQRFKPHQMKTEVKTSNWPQSAPNCWLSCPADMEFWQSTKFFSCPLSLSLLPLSFTLRRYFTFHFRFGTPGAWAGQGSRSLSLWLEGAKKRIGSSIIGHQMLLLVVAFCSGRRLWISHFILLLQSEYLTF